MQRSRTPDRWTRSRVKGANQAFTLVEMILAIGIAVGLLIVALLFYRQAADLRAQILQESERISTVRLILDRMAADLRSALPGSGSGREFQGETASMVFTKSPSAAPDAGATVLPGSLVRVAYTVLLSNEGTNRWVRGIQRSEEPLGSSRSVSSFSGVGTNAMIGGVLDVTNRVEVPWTELVRFARFRYWDGAVWQEGWTNASPPAGVEVSLGFDPLPEGISLDEYPYEQFRRVVFLPAGITLRTPGDAVGENSSPP